MTQRVEKKEMVLVEFEGGPLPNEVFYGLMKYKVGEYIPKPMRCFRCQEYAHITNACKRKARCVWCGGKHGYIEFEEGAKVKCCNCGWRLLGPPLHGNRALW